MKAGLSSPSSYVSSLIQVPLNVPVEALEHFGPEWQLPTLQSYRKGKKPAASPL
jgi:hypothetical protein